MFIYLLQELQPSFMHTPYSKPHISLFSLSPFLGLLTLPFFISGIGYIHACGACLTMKSSGCQVFGLQNWVLDYMTIQVTGPICQAMCPFHSKVLFLQLFDFMYRRTGWHMCRRDIIIFNSPMCLRTKIPGVVLS